MIGLSVLGGCGVPVVGLALEVDQIEEDRAVVIDRATGAAKELPTSALPKGAAEGDVVVDGRTDPELAAQMRAEVQRARARLLPSPLQSGGSLEDPAAGAPFGR